VGVQLVYVGHLLLAWGIIYDTKKIGYCLYFHLFLTGVGVYVGVRVCIRTHTHTLHVGYSDVSPGVGTRHLQSPKNPDGLNLRKYKCVYVYEVHMDIHMLGGGMRSSHCTNCVFLSFFVSWVANTQLIQWTKRMVYIR